MLQGSLVCVAVCMDWFAWPGAGSCSCLMIVRMSLEGVDRRSFASPNHSWNMSAR